MLLEYRSKLEQAIKQNNTNVAGIAQQVIAKIREIFVERDVPENYDEIYNIDSNNFGDYPEYIAPKK